MPPTVEVIAGDGFGLSYPGKAAGNAHSEAMMSALQGFGAAWIPLTLASALTLAIPWAVRFSYPLADIAGAFGPARGATY